MSKKLSNSLFILIIISCILLTLLLLKIIKIYNIICKIFGIIAPIIFGYITAWSLYPIFKKLKNKMSKKLSIVIIIILTLLFYLALALMIIPLVVNESVNCLTLVKKVLTTFKNIPFIKFSENLYDMNFSSLTKRFGGITNIIVDLFFTQILTFYILYNYETINSYIDKLIPQNYRKGIKKLFKTINKDLRLFVKGMLMDISALFGMCVVFFAIIGLKYSILLSIFVSITNVIPFIGPYIGGVPAVLIGLSISTKTGILTAASILIVQILESNLINPMIMSKMTEINPFLIIIDVTIMGKLFGIVGMIFAIPSIIVVKNVIEFIRNSKKMGEKSKIQVIS